MKKNILLFIALLILNFCAQKTEKIEKIIEDGIEVVLNHIVPYKIKREPSTFTLKEEFVIDLEREDLAEIGLAEIHDFDIDSDGNVYILDSRSKENLVFKFNGEGNYLKFFCPSGQGPGELPKAQKMMIRVTRDDVVVVYSNMKFLFFEPDGSLVKEVKSTVNIQEANYLDNGNYLIKTFQFPEGATALTIYMLYDSQFNKIKELDRIESPTGFSQRAKGTYHNIVAEVNAGKIFTGNQERDYEIYVYDLNGTLIRKVRKEYIKVKPSEEYKERFLGMWKSVPRVYEAVKKIIYFPSSLPPFHHFMTDEKGRLYIMTYEKGETPAEYMFDIFNPNGVFVGRKSLKDFSSHDHLKGKIKNDRFFCIEEKESGFQKLIVYKIIWQ